MEKALVWVLPLTKLTIIFREEQFYSSKFSLSLSLDLHSLQTLEQISKSLKMVILPLGILANADSLKFFSKEQNLDCLESVILYMKGR